MRTLVFLLLAAAALPAQEVRFNRDVRPILSNNCFQCHGPDQKTRMANLRLDDRDNALARGAIVPGDTTASKLVTRIHAADALQMPPAYSEKKLTDAQRETLTRWIEQGAEYEGHWSYQPPRRAPEAPAGPAAIDFFIDRKLKERGLTPVAEADRRTLARRLSLDLLGLPPDPARVEAFANDPSPDAYEKLVNELLASPHFGERMAVYWLDLVRYADTTGYHNDVPINLYPYRDYVIRAFNENKPFDQFTREQLAGDLIPDATPWQKVASAYNRLNRLTTEGGAQAKEYLAKYAADRVRTTATVWLGSTLACAECHDHKFDPFLTKDFYSMGAFFADIEEVGVFPRTGDYGPLMRILSESGRQEEQRIDAKLADLRDAGADKFPLNDKNSAAVERYYDEAAAAWRWMTPVSAADDCSDPDISGCEDLDLAIDGDRVVTRLLDEEAPRESVHVIETAAPNAGATALLLELGATEELPEFDLSDVRIELLRDGRRPLRLRFGALDADGESDKNPLRDTLDEEPQAGWVGDPCLHGPRRAMYVLDQPLASQAGDRLRFTLIYNGRGGQRIAGTTRLAWTASAFPEIPLAPGRPFDEVFAKLTGQNANWREIRRLERRKKALWDFADEVHISHAVEEPRTMRVLPRGNWMDDSGQIVEPQSPEFLGMIPADGRRLTRLDLANWLTRPDNPLTARVFVNRLWKLYFGVGLSARLDDLGSQGDPPTHPELLDWLAVEFMDSGWDVKHVLRTMLLSDAYRRSSNPSPELTAKDPFNRYFGRQAMFRLDAEMIRDSGLEVSGLLEHEIGGPSAKPYQPKGYYGELNFPKREYEANLDERQFRRGVYTHWQRTFLHPALLAFDAPTREECTAERAVSNTPLQSLALLNDPSFIEASRAFAARILESGADDQVDWAFRQAFARPATAAEREVVLKLVAKRRSEFEAAPERAQKLLDVGIYEEPPAAGAVELAAWTEAARALLNKHEFITRY